MAISLVQGTGFFKGSQAGSATFTYGSAVSNPNCLLVFVGFTLGGTTCTLSDSVNGSWNPVTIASASHNSANLFVLPNTASGTPTVTVTFTGTLGVWCALMEWSGIATSSPVDQTLAFHSAASTTAMSIGPSGSTTVANEAVIAAFMTNTNETWTPGNGTLITQGGANNDFAVSYYTVSSTGTQTANVTAGSSNNYDSVLLTLEAAPPSGGQPQAIYTRRYVHYYI